MKTFRALLFQRIVTSELTLLSEMVRLANHSCSTGLALRGGSSRSGPISVL